MQALLSKVVLLQVTFWLCSEALEAANSDNQLARLTTPMAKHF
jgi:hypothetical protein